MTMARLCTDGDVARLSDGGVGWVGGTRWSLASLADLRKDNGNAPASGEDR